MADHERHGIVSDLSDDDCAVGDCPVRSEGGDGSERKRVFYRCGAAATHAMTRFPSDRSPPSDRSTGQSPTAQSSSLRSETMPRRS